MHIKYKLLLVMLIIALTVSACNTTGQGGDTDPGGHIIKQAEGIVALGIDGEGKIIKAYEDLKTAFLEAVVKENKVKTLQLVQDTYFDGGEIYISETLVFDLCGKTLVLGDNSYFKVLYATFTLCDTQGGGRIIGTYPGVFVNAYSGFHYSKVYFIDVDITAAGIIAVADNNSGYHISEVYFMGGRYESTGDSVAMTKGRTPLIMLMEGQFISPEGIPAVRTEQGSDWILLQYGPSGSVGYFNGEYFTTLSKYQNDPSFNSFAVIKKEDLDEEILKQIGL